MTKKITISELYSQLEIDQYPIIDKEAKLVTVVDSKDNTKLIYRITREYPLEIQKIAMDLDKMASQLAEHFDAKLLLTEVLKKADSGQLLEIQDRLAIPDVSIKSKKACFSLMIGGKVGRPMELTLIE
jgi:hypothetical protein